jgi:hypothetical protein
MTAPAPASIELRVEHIAGLFDSLDPFPLPTRDLSGAAEAFIVGWAREIRRDAAFTLIVHVPEAEAKRPEAAALDDAIARHFNYRAQTTKGDLDELFRVGRFALAIGLGVLAACVAAGNVVSAALGDTAMTNFVRESLVILGWVANWRPLEIFLYDWWPLVQRRRLFQRLAAAKVELRPY